MLAIVLETIATASLKASQQFTKPLPTVLTILAYMAAFYCLSHTLKSIPIGTAYAMWSGIGIVLISVVGAVFYGQIPDWPMILGIVLIIAGMMTIHLFSKTSVH